ncbi:hypothetical protein Hanom_Chr08g00743491 [Helianthus anomalus]
MSHYASRGSKGNTTRTVDALSSRFRVICLDCKRFETVHTVVENAGGNLREDDIIQVVLINFRHNHNHEFRHGSVSHIIRFLCSNV